MTKYDLVLVPGARVLTPEQRDELVAKWAAGEANQKELAETYGVSQPTVSRMVAGVGKPCKCGCGKEVFDPRADYASPACLNRGEARRKARQRGSRDNLRRRAKTVLAARHHDELEEIIAELAEES